MTLRLDAQFAFLNEADRLKSVLRANELMNGARPENTAEHSWHLGLYALVMPVPADVDRARVIAMLLLHDLVEIDSGDHPIDQDFDQAEVARAEARAAKRLFGLLPKDQGPEFLALWHEFEAAETADARHAKRLDHSQPMFQVLDAAQPRADHIAVVRDNLATGRAARLVTEWPEVHARALAQVRGDLVPEAPNLASRLRFLAEADALKSVYRATTLVDGSRRENSGEHSWHLALYALVLADQAKGQVNIARVIEMLLIHDLVEIDVGDVPIHSANGHAHGSTDIQAAEAMAAKRLFGILPNALADDLHSLWQEFEAAQTPDAIFGKSLDRVQPVMANLMSGGGTWIEYDVTAEQLYARVGSKIAKGAPQIWDWVWAKSAPWFANRAK